MFPKTKFTNIRLNKKKSPFSRKKRTFYIYLHSPALAGSRRCAKNQTAGLSFYREFLFIERIVSSIIFFAVGLNFLYCFIKAGSSLSCKKLRLSFRSLPKSSSLPTKKSMEQPKKSDSFISWEAEGSLISFSQRAMLLWVVSIFVASCF